MGNNYTIIKRDGEVVDGGVEVPTFIRNPTTSELIGGCHDVCQDTWYVVKMYEKGEGIAEFRGYLSMMEGQLFVGPLNSQDSDSFIWKIYEDPDMRIVNLSGSRIIDIDIDIGKIDGKIPLEQDIGEWIINVVPIIDDELGYIPTGTSEQNRSECYKKCCRGSIDERADSCIEYSKIVPNRLEFVSEMCSITDRDNLPDLLDDVEDPMCREMVMLGDPSKIQEVCKSVYDVMKNHEDEFNLYLENNPEEWARLIDACACHMPEQYYIDLRESVRPLLDDDINQFLDRYGKTSKRSCWVRQCRSSALDDDPCDTRPLDLDVCWEIPDDLEYVRSCTRQKIDEYCTSEPNHPACIDSTPIPAGGKKKSSDMSMFILAIITALIFVFVILFFSRSRKSR